MPYGVNATMIGMEIVGLIKRVYLLRKMAIARIIPIGMAIAIGI
jgi:hypothetical protein